MTSSIVAETHTFSQALDVALWRLFYVAALLRALGRREFFLVA
jgi:hypothetical protein